MTDDPIIQKLWDYGYFFAPSVRDVAEITYPQLKPLTVKDPVVKEAVRLYQDNLYHQLIPLVEHYHDRPAVVDGDIGPATSDLITIVPRCGVPDYFATEQEANFPTSCRNQLTYSYKPGTRFIGLDPDDLPRLFDEAGKNWSRVIDINLEIRPSSEYPNTHIHGSAKRLSGSVLAWMELTRGSCSDHLENAIDSDRSWSERLFVTTMSHEFGHSWGYGHSNNPQALMYPSITDASLSRRGAPHEADIQAMLRLGYNRRTDPVPDPEPEPEQQVGTLKLTQALPSGEYRIVRNSGGNGWRI